MLGGQQQEDMGWLSGAIKGARSLAKSAGKAAGKAAKSDVGRYAIKTGGRLAVDAADAAIRREFGIDQLMN